MNEVYSVWFKIYELPTTWPKLIFKREDDFSLSLLNDKLIMTKENWFPLFKPRVMLGSIKEDTWTHLLIGASDNYVKAGLNLENCSDMCLLTGGDVKLPSKIEFGDG